MEHDQNRPTAYHQNVRNGPEGENETDKPHDLFMNPGFWARVFDALKRNKKVAEEIRRDLEFQENRVLRGERISSVPHGEDGRHAEENGMEAADDDRRNVDESPGFDGRQVPELYTLLDRGLGHFKQRTVTQHLGSLVDDLDIENLWSSRDVTLSFGPFFGILLRLFTGPYETDEENVIVEMLRLGLERASGNFEYTDPRREGSTSTEPFFVTYRRKGRALRDFSAFRYMLEIVENMGRCDYTGRGMLATVKNFWHSVTVSPVSQSPSIMARPMTIEMHFDSLFGNVSTNTRLLERSLLAAFNNRNRRSYGSNAAREVESLLSAATLLDLSFGDAATGRRPTLKPFTIKKEHVALRHMLETSTIVSMMAEEFRVFIAGAPQSRCGESGSKSDRSNKRPSTATNRDYGSVRQPFRRPVFFAFKPISQAVTNKDVE
ncbi:hypothetical protein J6590_096383 [Homalodisca vitripennis]|nr:hypothetical protein J6590_096383 [Homalodisca vitripennis]